MSKDPLEELFGSAAEEPEPVPARDRLAYEQAERVRTAQLATKPVQAKRNSKLTPWIIVGFVAVAALVVSILLVNTARGGDETAATPTPAPTQQPTTTSPTATPEPTESEEPAPEEDRVPSVEVGPTNNMPIGPWNATSELSQKLGSTSFSIPDGSNLVLSSALLDSFPAECADMRAAWGATLLEDGTYEIRKPVSACAAAPELYDEIWGLIAAWVDTIKPL